MDETIQVAGLPVMLAYGGAGFYVTATFQNVMIQGSPLVVRLDPPVATVQEVSLPGLVDALADAIRGGATLAL